jgi:hypothetical protein
LANHTDPVPTEQDAQNPRARAQIEQIERLLAHGEKHFDIRIECTASIGNQTWPVYAVGLGNASPGVPAVGFFGGVHGLERIGSEVVVAYMKSLLKRLEWDSLLHRKLESLRLVFMPLVNPGGLLLGTRANPAGVDLMRNAPVDAVDKVPFLVGGQRYSNALPWYRGTLGAPMEPEAQALCAVVERELLPRPFSLALDCHSGFGLRDRIWFPFACSTQAVRHLPEIAALTRLFDETYENHRYVFEPQSSQYCAHGDLWDYLYLKAEETPARTFIPLTLEMGSWMWVKKNPRQFFSRYGMFNPQIEHRQQRVLRRHLSWMEFLCRAGCSWERWIPVEAERDRHAADGLARWYGKRSQ